MATESETRFEHIPEEFSELQLEELDDWEEFNNVTETESNEGETFSVCTCGIPSTEDLVECSLSENCVGQIRWFHKACIDNAPKDVGKWTCNECQRTEIASAKGESEKVPTSDSQQKKAGGMQYPEKVFRKTDATVLAHDFTVASVEQVLSDELFKMDTLFCRKVRELAIHLQNELAHDNFKLFSKELVQNMWSIIKPLRGVRWTEKKKSEMWGNFHNFRMKESNFEKWNELLASLKIRNEEEIITYMLQHIMKEVFTSLLSTLMETDMPALDAQPHPISLDNEEQQALRYCAGYVPFKLKKRYLKMKGNEVAKQFISIIDSWVDTSSESDESEDFTKAWIGMQNRGGLFRVNNEVYSFFKRLEMEVRKTVSLQNISQLQGINLQDMLCKKLEDSNSITLAWFHLTPHLSSTCRLKLFTEVTHCFTKMRSEAFLKVYIDIRKGREAGVARKQEKGLRTSLKK